MNKFLLAHSADRPGDELLDDCLNQLSDIPPEANFGFLYLSDRVADQADFILDQLQTVTGISDWVGTVGIGILAASYTHLPLPPHRWHVYGGRWPL